MLHQGELEEDEELKECITDEIRLSTELINLLLREEKATTHCSIKASTSIGLLISI